MMARLQPTRPLVAALLALGVSAPSAPPALAGEIRATSGPRSLRTLVNASGSDACTSGTCAISGGTRAGGNLFHRFDRFQADGAITGVTVDTGGANAVILGVVDTAGALFNRSLSLNGGSADLFVLAPGGLMLQSGAGFTNVQALTLSTATGLRFGGVSPGQRFDVFHTDEATALGLTGSPLPGRGGLLNEAGTLSGLGLATNGDLELQGGLLTVDRDLLLDAKGGHLLLNGARIQAPGRVVELAGRRITIDAASRLSVEGSDAGNAGSLAINADSEIEILAPTMTPSAGASVVSNEAIRSALAGGGTVAITATTGPLSVRSAIVRDAGTLPAELRLRSGSDLVVDNLLAVRNTTAAPLSVDLRHGSGSQVLWRRGDVSLGSNDRLTVGPDPSGAPGHLRLTDSGPVRIVTLDNGQVSTGRLSWAPGSATTLKLANQVAFTVTDDLLQGPGNRIQAGDGTELTVAGTGTIDGGRLIAAASVFNPPIPPRLRVGPAGRLVINGGQFEGFAIDVAAGGRLAFSGIQNLVRPLQISNQGLLTETGVAGGLPEARFNTTQAPLTLTNGPTGQIQVNRRLDLGPGSTLLNQGLIALANGAILDAGALTTTSASRIELLGDGAARLALRQSELRNEGTISGTGTVQLNAAGTGRGRLVNAGYLFPGGYPGIGTLTVVGDLALAATSQVAFSLAGTNPGVTSDFLRVEGDVTLGGAVNYEPIPGYQPAVGSKFELIRSTGTLSGGFASTPDTGQGASVILEPSATSTSFLVTATSRPEPPTNGGGGNPSPEPDPPSPPDPDPGPNPNPNPTPDPTPTPNPSPTPTPDPQASTPSASPPGKVPPLPPNLLNPVIFPGVQISAGAVPSASLIGSAGSQLSVSLDRVDIASASSTGAESFGRIGFGVSGLEPAQIATAVLDGDRARTDDLTRSIDGLSAPPGAPESLTLAELQKLLKEAEQASRGTAHPFVPALLSLSFTRRPADTAASGEAGDSFLDLTLILPNGDPEGRRVDLSRLALQEELRLLYGQLARQEPLGEQDPASPTRRLHEILIAPLLPALERNGITSLLIVADRGLHAVPFAALHDGRQWFGERFGFSLSPSLRFTSLAPPGGVRGRTLAVGASQFSSLAPLPLVPDELAGIPRRDGVDAYLNKQFTPEVLLARSGDPRYDRLHVATHAEFRPGGASQARIYTGTDTLSLQDFVRLRRARADRPLELVALSACRTAIGDSDSELGFSGLALISGSRSAIGTLWYVDDVATSAYFLQLYRFLDQGLPKADALRATRQAMAEGRLRRVGDAILATDGTPLLTGLTPAQQRRVANGMGHPYFWAGVQLLGTPW